MLYDKLMAFLITLDSGKVLLSIVPAWGDANGKLKAAETVAKSFDGQILQMTAYPDTGDLVEGVMELTNPLPGFNPDRSKSLEAHIVSAEKAMSGLRNALSNIACDLIVSAAERIAPDATSFQDALHVGFPAGEHAMMVAETALAIIFRDNPSAIDAVRGSSEWDHELPLPEPEVAANALLRETMLMAEEVWTARSEPGSGMTP